jgi:hypothetical protein
MGKYANRAAALRQKVVARRNKAATQARSRVTALPKMPRVAINSNYVNPVTLNFPKGSIVVYELKNKRTGRVDYYDRATFWSMMGIPANNYKLLMMNPKEPIPGARNPVTRGAIYPRNVRRVTVAAKKKTPSPNTAAKKIQSAVRKMLSKKRQTPSTPKSKSKSRSK